MTQDTTANPNKRVALIVGAGDAIGSAIARKFADEGLVVYAVRRDASKLEPLLDELKSAGHEAYGAAVDARMEDSIVELFADIESSIGALEVVVFNVGANVPMSLTDTSSRKFLKIWEMACFAGFSGRPRGSEVYAGASARHDYFYRCNSQCARRCGLCRVCQRQARFACPGAVDGARAWARQYSCCAYRY